MLTCKTFGRLIEENKDLQTLSNENSFRSLPSNDDLEGYNNQEDVRFLVLGSELSQSPLRIERFEFFFAGKELGC